jgi:4-hydroxy-tetrahydrodipicolinate reductase
MKIKVMVNGLPGKMAAKVAEHVLESDDMELAPEALTGEDIEQETWEYKLPGSKVSVALHKPSVRDSKIQEFREIYSDFISVDFTQPGAVNDNVDFYCRNRLPFVCGTTGGDRAALEKRVQDSDIPAVIAPNMAKQIVALQSLMEKYAAENENRFRLYRLSITESHQKGKKDTSGTAKAMVKYFQQLGIDFDVEQIKKIREPEEQLALGVPPQYLSGHGWHRYELGPSGDTSPLISLAVRLSDLLRDDKLFEGYAKDELNTGCCQLVDRRSYDGTVFFRLVHCGDGSIQIRHDVNGRDIYAGGTLDAIRFLEKRLDEKGKDYSMIDVLKGE